VVRGRARVVTDPKTAEVQAGEILVAERTDPGWILLFAGAVGVVVERGSVLSHSAIVARELGIPAVVSVAGLTSWLTTGDLIEVNGSSGVVTRITEPTEDAPPAAQQQMEASHVQ
jgi:pyruvate,water dikinase